MREYQETDNALRKQIAYQEQQLTRVKPDSWTAGIIREKVAALQAQLALPRKERIVYRTGSPIV